MASLFGHVAAGAGKGLGEGITRVGEYGARQEEKREERAYKHKMLLLRDKLATDREDKIYTRNRADLKADRVEDREHAKEVRNEGYTRQDALRAEDRKREDHLRILSEKRQDLLRQQARAEKLADVESVRAYQERIRELENQREDLLREQAETRQDEQRAEDRGHKVADIESARAFKERIRELDNERQDLLRQQARAEKLEDVESARAYQERIRELENEREDLLREQAETRQDEQRAEDREHEVADQDKRYEQALLMQGKQWEREDKKADDAVQRERDQYTWEQEQEKRATLNDPEGRAAYMSSVIPDTTEMIVVEETEKTGGEYADDLEGEGQPQLTIKREPRSIDRESFEPILHSILDHKQDEYVPGSMDQKKAWYVDTTDDGNNMESLVPAVREIVEREGLSPANAINVLRADLRIPIPADQAMRLAELLRPPVPPEPSPEIDADAELQPLETGEAPSAPNQGIFSRVGEVFSSDPASPQSGEGSPGIFGRLRGQSAETSEGAATSPTMQGPNFVSTPTSATGRPVLSESLLQQVMAARDTIASSARSPSIAGDLRGQSAESVPSGGSATSPAMRGPNFVATPTPDAGSPAPEPTPTEAPPRSPSIFGSLRGQSVESVPSGGSATSPAMYGPNFVATPTPDAGSPAPEPTPTEAPQSRVAGEDPRDFQQFAEKIETLGPEAKRAIEGLASGNASIDDLRLANRLFIEWASEAGLTIPNDLNGGVMERFINWVGGKGA